MAKTPMAASDFSLRKYNYDVTGHKNKHKIHNHSTTSKYRIRDPHKVCAIIFNIKITFK